MRPALLLALLALLLAPSAAALVELPLVEPPALEWPLEPTAAEAGVPGVAEASVSVAAGDGPLPALAVQVRLDAARLRLALATPVPILAPRPFAAAPAASVGEADGEAAPGTHAPLGDAPRAGAAGPSDEGAPVVTLALRSPTPLETSPVAAGVALGVTALLAVLARLYSRFGRDGVLRSPVRARIHAHVGENPGATLADLAAATGLGRSTVAHHCRMLERHGVLASRNDGLHRRFHVAGPRLDLSGRPPTAGERRVLDLLRERGPLTQAEVAGLLGVTPQAVSYHILRLRRDARVEMRVDGGQRRWAVADAQE